MQMPCVGISVHRLAGSSVHREGGGGGLTSAAPMDVAVKDQICRGGADLLQWNHLDLRPEVLTLGVLGSS